MIGFSCVHWEAVNAIRCGRAGQFRSIGMQSGAIGRAHARASPVEGMKASKQLHDLTRLAPCC